jgi:hypothetical protein
MAKKGVVFITINYRLGIFGFLAHPELSKESPNQVSGNLWNSGSDSCPSVGEKKRDCFWGRCLSGNSSNFSSGLILAGRILPNKILIYL